MQVVRTHNARPTSTGHQKNTPYGGIFSLDEARRAVRASKKYPLWGIFTHGARRAIKKIPPIGGISGIIFGIRDEF